MLDPIRAIVFMENLNIYIDRLSEGQEQELQESLDPIFMGIFEDELSFEDPIELEGKAYLTDDHLLIEMNVSTCAKMPCTICNELTSIPVIINHSYLTIPLQEIKGAIYNCADTIRESLLLELPSFAECEGTCKKREVIKTFLNKEQTDDSNHFPFSGLE